MRTEGHVVTSGGGWGGDHSTPLPRRTISQRRPTPPSPTAIRNPAPAPTEDAPKKGTSRKGLVYGPRPDDWQNPLRLDRSRVKRVIAMYERGLSVNRISTETGIAKSTILRHLKDNGVTIRGAVKDLDMDFVVREFDRGVPARELGRRLGVAPATIIRRLRQMGYDTSRKARPMISQRIITWCTQCEDEAGSLCEVDEHSVVVARQGVDLPEISSVRPGEVDHVCVTCFMNPGSELAQAVGCRCPTMDNGRGHNVDRLVVVDGCPVHQL